MVRRYDSTLRREAASRTRRQILQAALELHWDGITGYGPLAEAAGCSEATVRKHFPTKEDLFRNCTRTFAETLIFPDLDALGSIDDPDRRLRAGVTELTRIHEAMFGYAWMSAQLRDDSPVLDAELRAYEGLIDATVAIVAPRVERGPVRGLLDFLTWRALRLAGDLDPDAATDHLIAILRPMVLDAVTIRPDEFHEKDAKP